MPAQRATGAEPCRLLPGATPRARAGLPRLSLSETQDYGRRQKIQFRTYLDNPLSQQDSHMKEKHRGSTQVTLTLNREAGGIPVGGQTSQWRSLTGMNEHI